jgi:hypothetical protein
MPVSLGHYPKQTTSRSYENVAKNKDYMGYCPFDLQVHTLISSFFILA